MESRQALACNQHTQIDMLLHNLFLFAMCSAFDQLVTSYKYPSSCAESCENEADNRSSLLPV